MKLILMILIGMLSTGCSSSASTFENAEPKEIPTELTTEKENTMETKEIKEETEEKVKEEVKEEANEITKDKAVELIRKIMSNNSWEFAENIIANNKEGYLIQHSGTDADFRFFVDKKTGDAYCEKSTLVDEYKLVKNIDDVESYLMTNKDMTNNSQPSNTTNSSSNNNTKPNNESQPKISTQEAKELVERLWGGLYIGEPVRTNFNGKDTWKITYQYNAQGTLLTNTVYVDCQTGEIYPS